MPKFFEKEAGQMGQISRDDLVRHKERCQQTGIRNTTTQLARSLGVSPRTVRGWRYSQPWCLKVAGVIKGGTKGEVRLHGKYKCAAQQIKGRGGVPTFRTLAVALGVQERTVERYLKSQHPDLIRELGIYTESEAAARKIFLATTGMELPLNMKTPAEVQIWNAWKQARRLQRGQLTIRDLLLHSDLPYLTVWKVLDKRPDLVREMGIVIAYKRKPKK